MWILFLITQITVGQTGNEQVIYGKIVADSAAVGAIDVVNLVNETATITNSKGEFFIRAKANDVLVLSGANVEYKRKVIEMEDLKLAIVIINMIPKIVELNEVIVNDKTRISSESIGVFQGQKSYTPAERKLYTARSGILDRPLNWISGRTDRLRKEVVIERKERLLYMLEGVFQDQYYTETLKIPSDYIKDFQYYSIDDPDFVAALKAKNKTMLTFLIKRLALNYKGLFKS